MVTKSPLLKRLPKELLHEQPTDDELIQGFKAVHDTLKERLHSDLKSLETSLTIRMSKSIEGAQQQIVANAIKSLETKLLDTLGGYIEDRVKALANEKLMAICNDIKTLFAEISGFRQMQDYGLAQIKQLLEELPIPSVQVTLPDSAIEVRQMPSIVNLPEGCIAIEVNQLPSIVNLPDSAINVEVNQLPSAVHISDKAFHLTVDQATPQINVTMPKKGKTTKTILYDQYNRPQTITEEEGEL